MSKAKPKIEKEKETIDFRPKIFSVKNEAQADVIRSIVENQITFITGKAGTGKTVLGVYTAIKALREDLVERIVICRPAVEGVGEKLGFLPGSYEEKTAPYLIPIFDEFKKYCSKEEINLWKAEGKLEIAALAYIRGRNFHNTFLILDEAQNCTYEQLVMVLTRLGMRSKMVINGDFSQSDLPRHMQGGLKTISDKLTNLEGIGVVDLPDSGIIRNPLIAKILGRLEENNGTK